jgi:diguanylate cyclase (GGDEF)-like protein/PAS domain S-box-containing protein
MKIGQKLTLGYLLVSSLAGFITYTALQSYSNIDTAFVRLTDDPVKMTKALENLRLSGFRVISSTSEIGFLVSQAEKADREKMIAEEEKELATDGVETFEISLQNFDEQINKSDDSEIETRQEIDSRGKDLITTSAELIEMLKKGASRKEIFAKKEEFESREDAYIQTLNDALTEEYRELAEQKQNVHSTILLSTRITYLVTSLIFILALVLGWYISRSISTRIVKLQKASEKVGAGQLEIQIEIGPRDEITDLARSFNKMIDDLKVSRTARAESESRFRSVVDSANDAIISADADGHILSWNDSARKIFGYDVKEVLGKSIAILFPPSDSRYFAGRERIARVVASGWYGAERKATEMEGVKKGDIRFPAEVSISSWETSEGVFYGGIVRDITDRKLLEDELSHQALHDSLTKLANRVLFRDRVEQALKQIGRNRTPVGVLFLDLDNFKTINDSLGHTAGDELLVAVAQRLQACLRPGDTAARLGGDEFAILVEDTTNAEGSLLVAERIRDIMRTPFALSGKELFIGASIGVVTTLEGNMDPAELLRNADVAMYMAKSQGKDRYAVFETGMDEAIVKRIQMETDMRGAIERREFMLHYQPILDLQSANIMGMEALVRWIHPEQGLIPPLDFIGVAEETNLIIPLGQWILEEACTQARQWQIDTSRGEDLSITVNISSRQFQDEGLVAVVKEALKKSGLSARSLILEITEGTMLVNNADTLRKLTDLKAVGVRLAIDDFGTGYSSLSYLQRFPVDIIKIDKSFVDRVDQGREGAAVTRAIITMSDSLHLTTIAEGIEKPEQCVKLQKLGCEMGQGFLFARPLSTNDMTEFLHCSFSRQGEDKNITPEGQLTETDRQTAVLAA